VGVVMLLRADVDESVEAQEDVRCMESSTDASLM
jgi:hypothetical protein